MSIIGILPTVLLGALFIAVGVFVWKKKRLVSAIPFLIGAMLILYGFNIYANAKGRKQATRDYNLLVRELGRKDFRQFLAESDDEETIYFVSLASQALYRTAERFPSQKERVMPLLAEFTKWIGDSRKFPIWRGTRYWKDHAFFMAHAGIILGHYQDISKDETYAQRFKQVGEYLGRGIPNARYKHLVSRPDEDMMRPTDNAAAIYAVSLYDRYYATEYSAVALTNWKTYVERELEFAESHLPCAGFTETNRCKLDPTASPMGMLLGYLASAGLKDQMLYREWLHYYKNFGVSPLSLNFNSGMRAKGNPRFCDVAAHPLTCEKHLPAIGMWLAAEYGGEYTYARLLSQQVLSGNHKAEVKIAAAKPLKRRLLLTDVAIRVIAGMK